MAHDHLKCAFVFFFLKLNAIASRLSVYNHATRVHIEYVGQRPILIHRPVRAIKWHISFQMNSHNDNEMKVDKRRIHLVWFGHLQTHAGAIDTVLHSVTAIYAVFRLPKVLQ